MNNEILTKKQRRELRKEAQRKVQKSQDMKRKLKRLSSMFGLLVLIGIIAIFFGKSFLKPSPGTSIETQGNLHISDINTPHIPYNTKPPTSGPHLENIAPWGVSKEQIPDELQVHNLEDGGVGVQYYCKEPCTELIQGLERIMKDYANAHVFMAPYQEMEHRIALTAWGRIDAFDDFDENRIRVFIDIYEGIDRHVR